MHPPTIALLVMFSCCLNACAQEGPASRMAARGQDLEPASLPSGGGVHPHGGMLRFPDVSETHIVFSYANDLWLVPRDGGVATPLANPPGPTGRAKFSPDGRTIAFVGNYDGNRDLYTVPVEGGVPRRVTHHPAAEFLSDWTPHGKLIFYGREYVSLQRQEQLFMVSPEGGLPEKLPVPYGAEGAISPDGQWLAYVPFSRSGRTWKRYVGGMNSDIWLFNLRDHTARKITDWQGTDVQPMWHRQMVYYLSDAGPEHRFNIWSYDTTTGDRQQITHFEDFDVKRPSMGPGPAGQAEIVFQHAANLHLLDLKTARSRIVEVAIPGARPSVRPRTVDASKYLASGDISPTAKRLVVEARGDIWTIPAEKGPPRNLTHTDGQAERDPAWSPDGRWIAYFSDASGEYELYITQSDGRGETRQLTELGPGFRYQPTWSPDSKHIVFFDDTGGIFLHTLETGETKQVDWDPGANLPHLTWSHDSGWLAYTKENENLLWSIWLYNIEAGESHLVTSGMFFDTWPTFDRQGDYLFLASQRDFSSPTYDDNGDTFIYNQTDTLVVIPLREEVGSPFAPESDEESWEEQDEDEGEEEQQADEPGESEEEAEDEGEHEEDEGGQEQQADEPAETEQAAEDEGEDEEDEAEEPEPLRIDLEGFERRAIRLPVERGAFFNLAVTHDNKLVYTRRHAEGESSIKIFDLDDEEKEEKTVLAGVLGFRISADGKKLVVRKGRRQAIIDAAPDQKFEPVSLKGMNVTIDPRAEWRQMFNDAWRLYRDFFYDPNMHGVDWVALREHYAEMLDDCFIRDDLNFILAELIAELNCGHTYLWNRGDVEEAPSVSVGLLGCDFELHDGAYRIARIYEAGPWDVDGRGPLSTPGMEVKEGDYLLAVNGLPMDISRDPWAAFQDLADRTVTLTVSDKPTIDEDARHVLVEPVSSETDLRYRAWVEKNRAHVEQRTDGQVGYVHVPNTGTHGQGELVRQFLGQRDKAALIIDERWNGGGQDPDRFVELLNRPALSYRPSRHGRNLHTPRDSHQGPKCMLINGRAGSGGDLLPYYFRKAGLGKLIGTRTWGGVVGLSGNPGLIDGGRVSVPTRATYETDGTWGIEGHGVEPDIKVIDDPSLMVDGQDPQLDAAIEHMLEQIQQDPYAPPPRPAYPDRTGMGIRDEDK